MLGPDGHIQEAPAFFYDILDLDSRDIPSIYHLFDPDDPPYMSFARVVRRPNGVVEYHVSVNGSLGGEKGFRYWNIPALDPAQRARASTFYITDESAVIQGYEWERRRMRREILRDVQLTVTDFLSQKVAGIRALAEVRRDVPEAADAATNRIIMGLDSMRAALSQMGTTSMVNLFGPASDQPLRVRQMPEVLSVWSNGKTPIHCTVGAAEDEAFVAASLLEGVLLPVVTNALEATTTRDPVRIRVEQIDENFVEFRIKDSGPGMSEISRNRCEDPFYSTKPGHLGLGLTHAGEILKSAGGEWTFTGSDTRGTHVIIRLPLSDGDQFLGAPAQPAP